MGPVISVVSLLLAIPIIVRLHGIDAWTAIAVGTSVGAFGGMLVALSWPQLGPVAVARADVDERARIFADSTGSRLVMLAILAGPIAAVSAVLAPSGHVVTAALTALAFAAMGLTSGWYYIGIGAPRQSLVNVAAVRALAVLVSCVAMIVGASLLIYPAALIGASTTSLLINLRSVGTRRYGQRWWYWRGVADEWRSHKPIVLSRLIQGLYFSGSTAIVAAVAPVHAPHFAVLDRLTKSGVNGAVSFPQALTAWVVGRDMHQGRRRLKAGLLADAAFCLALGMFCYAVLPTAVQYLLDGAYRVEEPVRWLFAAVVAMTVFNRGLRMHALLTLGLERYAAKLTIVVSCLGSVGLMAGIAWAGILGAQVVLLTAEVVWATAGMTRAVYFLHTLDARGAPDGAPAENPIGNGPSS